MRVFIGVWILLGGTSFATCFLCNEKGHLSSQCPSSQRGIYPKVRIYVYMHHTNFELVQGLSFDISWYRGVPVNYAAALCTWHVIVQEINQMKV
jgi:hypothetical protein